MKLFLQTSSGQPSIVLWDNEVLFEAQFPQMARLDYGAELLGALNSIDASMAMLDGIIVDIGPGRLGSTRTAVAFANGLGFALNIPLIPLSSISILGIHAEKTHQRPCLVLRKAARRQFHWALVRNGLITETGFAEQAEIIPTSYVGPIVMAGDGDAESVALPSLPDVRWSGITLAPGAALAGLTRFLHPAIGPVLPLIDTRGLADGNR